MISTLLEKLHPAYHAKITTSGTAAAFLAFRAIRQAAGEGEVILPATICPSIPIAARAAGLAPRFVDVDPQTFCASPESISASIGPGTRAILLVYLFGKFSDYRAVMETAKRSGAFVIEDMAQAYGSFSGPLRQATLERSDFAILSFNPKKMIRSATGGALLWRKESFPRGIQLPALPELSAAEAGEKSAGQESFNAELRLAFQRLRAGGAPFANEPLAETKISRAAEDLLFGCAELEAELEGKECLAREIGSMGHMGPWREKYELYEKKLDPRLEFVRYSKNEIPWRLPLLLPKGADQAAVVNLIRAKGILVSDHYFPMHVFFSGACFPHADEIGLRAINLWVDEKIDADQIQTVAELLNSLLTEEKPE